MRWLWYAITVWRVFLPKLVCLKLSLVFFPGFGGSVRLPRLIGIDNALEAIATGKAYRPDEALKLGLVDAVVADELLEQAAADLVKKNAY